MKIKTFFVITFIILAINSVIYATETQYSTITVNSSLNKEYAPDTAKINFYVENSGTNLADIKAKNDKIVSDAISKIKAKLNNDETIKTIAFSVNNIYSYKDKVKILQKYEVRNGFEVKLKDLNKISEIVKIAMDSGVKRIGNINFSIEKTDNICNEMLSSVAKTAKSNAQNVATALDTSILKVKSANPYCSVEKINTYSRYSNKMMATSADASSGELTETIEPGTINVRSSIDITYYLK